MLILNTLKLTADQSTRGWCYQEHALSPRCLVFTDSECFFTCADGVWREAYHSNGEVRLKGNIHGFNRRYRRGRRQPKSYAAVSVWQEQRVIYSLSHGNEDQSFPQYQEAVHDYTGRQLTYKTDIIAAFAGMLRTFCAEEVPYHGIPLSIFEHALCWSESADAERLQAGSGGCPRMLAVSRRPASATEVGTLPTRRRSKSRYNLTVEGTDANTAGLYCHRASIPYLVVGILVSASHLRRFDLLGLSRTI